MPRSKRKRGNRKINPTFFVFCEGKTEASYVAYLRKNFRIPIQIKTKISGSRINENQIKSCLKHETKTSKDKIFLLYDLDVDGVLDRILAIKNAELLISNPCIELWFLLHFQNQTANLNSEHCLQLLKGHITNYKKGSQRESIMNEICDRVDKAVERANQLNSPKNPSTTVQVFIEIIRDLKEKNKNETQQR